MTQTNSHRQRLTLIVDTGRLAKLIDGKVRKQFGSNLSKAARAIGISQPTLHALANGARSSLRERTGLALRNWLRTDIEELRSCVLTPAAARLLEAYSEHQEDYWVAYLMRGQQDQETVRRRAKKFRFLRNLLRARLPSYCNTFDADVKRLGHSESRLEQAYFDIVAGILDDEAIGYMERHWSELSEDELRRYVDLGMKRERIRLKRSPDIQRVQERASQGRDLPEKTARPVNRVAGRANLTAR